MKLIKEFKEFAIKGNMFDMAIGIIIGSAFNKIISSLVNDIIMPLLSLVVGKVNFQNLKYTLQDQLIDNEGNVTKELVVFKYGLFIQVALDFLLVAVTVFFIIKVFNKLRRKAEDDKDQTVKPSKEIELLSEIRDLMKEKK